MSAAPLRLFIPLLLISTCSVGLNAYEFQCDNIEISDGDPENLSIGSDLSTPLDFLWSTTLDWNSKAKVTSIMIKNCTVEHDAILKFDDFPELQSLTLAKLDITRLDLMSVSNNVRLRELNLIDMEGLVEIYNNPKISLHNITILGSGITVRPPILYHLKSLKHLKVDFENEEKYACSTLRKLQTFNGYDCNELRQKEKKDKAQPTGNELRARYEMYDSNMRSNDDDVNGTTFLHSEVYLLPIALFVSIIAIKVN